MTCVGVTVGMICVGVTVGGSTSADVPHALRNRTTVATRIADAIFLVFNFRSFPTKGAQRIALLLAGETR